MTTWQVNQYSQPPLPICRFYGSAAGCIYGSNCPFSHNYPQSVPLCHSVLLGTMPCPNGNRCGYRHCILSQDIELQNLQPITRVPVFNSNHNTISNHYSQGVTKVQQPRYQSTFIMNNDPYPHMVLAKPSPQIAAKSVSIDPNLPLPIIMMNIRLLDSVANTMRLKHSVISPLLDPIETKLKLLQDKLKGKLSQIQISMNP